MSVRYVRVRALADLFTPAIRAYGNIAVVGPVAAPVATTPAANTPKAYTNGSDALTEMPGPVGTAIAMTFRQSPGPSLVWAVREGGGGTADALKALELVDAQILLVANTTLTAASAAPTGAIGLLAAHVTSVSTTGDDGKERIGVAMLPKASVDTTQVAGALAHERMVYIAHKSDEDAAAAVAGTIAGYEPHISILLKPVNITSGTFSAADIATLNGSETFLSGPAGNGVNWLTDPVLIPGAGMYMAEGYTGNPGGKKYIDIVRTVDDVSFQLKARLIKTVGDLRISRSGLRAFTTILESVLDPLVRREVIEGYDIVIPILILLDKDPGSLTASELAQISQAQNDRVVEVQVAVDYAGAIHRIALTLKFE